MNNFNRHSEEARPKNLEINQMQVLHCALNDVFNIGGIHN